MTAFGYKDVVDTVSRILDQYPFKLTAKQLYYCAVANGLANDAGIQRSFITLMSRARELGDIDGTKIVDRTRLQFGGDAPWSTGNAYLQYKLQELLVLKDNASLSCWDGQPEYIEVWIDKDALAIPTSYITNKYKVTLCTAKIAAADFYRAAISRFKASVEEGRSPSILHLTDHDPDGLVASKKLAERLGKYLTDGLKVDLARVDLTYETVKAEKLQRDPTHTKVKDLIYEQQFGNECWELESLNPGDYIRLVEKHISGHIDADIWEQRQEEIKSERETLGKLIDALFSKVA